MAKIKVRARPGALSDLLRMKGMTQMDAFGKTRVDRKTLSKIDRGEDVKLETLQQVANKLQVTEEYFRHPPSAEVIEDSDVSEPGTVMVRKFDVARLEQLFREDPSRLEWQLNAPVPVEVRKFLEDFETAVKKFQDDLFLTSDAVLSLRDKLDRLKTAEEIAAGLERLAEHGLAVLAADYLFWNCSYEEGEYEGSTWSTEKYTSRTIVLLSIEPFGTQSRRAHIFAGMVPPTSPQPIDVTTVYVNGLRLPSLEEL